jgi:hypothetical protein
LSEIKEEEMELQEIVIGGFATGALIATLVNLGKQIGLVQDGAAPLWSLALNVAAYALLRLAQYYQFEPQAGQVLDALHVLLGVFGPLAVQVISSGAFHELGRKFGLPAFGSRQSVAG